MYALGIDLGTTFTAAAVWRDGRAEISSLGSRGAAIPSVVVLREDETLITGEPASRRALSSPHRVAREFKRRLGDTTPILLAGVPYSAEALMARMLRAVVEEVTAREGGAPAAVCISHPANWGPYKTDLLRQAVRSADLDEVRFTTEPEAAAVFYAQQQRVPEGAVIAVYDLGGGTFDAAVLRKTPAGFEILGRPEGIERLGGIDIDAAVFAHVVRTIGGALGELDEDDPAAIAAVARLRDECTQAKEALSADTDTTIPVLLPNLSTEVRLTRVELEAMVRPALQDTLDALRRALRSAGTAPEDLHSVLLVGGSSRMPIVSQLVGAELGRPVAVDAHPKHAVALGAAMLASTALAPAPPVAEVRSEPARAVEIVAPERTSQDVTEVFPEPVAASAARTRMPTAVMPPVSGLPADPGRPASSGRLAPPGRPVRPAGSAWSGRADPASRAPGSRRTVTILAAAAAVVLVAAAGTAAAIQFGGDDKDGAQQLSGATRATPGTAVSGSQSARPADERCTDEIKANERWVCLTSATFDGTTLTIKYRASFPDGEPAVDGGHHLHIYGASADGSEPAAETMGSRAATPGRWYDEDARPSVRKASSSDYAEAIGDSPKVCARIATADHALVPDSKGAFGTGNCVPIKRV